MGREMRASFMGAEIEFGRPPDRLEALARGVAVGVFGSD